MIKLEILTRRQCC